MGDKLGHKVGDKVGDMLGDTAGGKVEDKVGYNVGDKLGDKVGDKVIVTHLLSGKFGQRKVSSFCCMLFSLKVWGVPMAMFNHQIKRSLASKGPQYYSGVKQIIQYRERDG